MRNRNKALTPVAAEELLGADLYRLLSDNEPDTVFSPSSVACALQMVLCGARGGTAAELARALHQKRSPDAAAQGLHLLTALVSEVSQRGTVTLRAPNTVWVQSSVRLLPEFTARLQQAAAAAVNQADFARAPEAARAEINQVIREQTSGKIADLLPPFSINHLTRLVLASAVYLKAAWEKPFSVNATGDAPFYPDGPDGRSLSVPMMHDTATRPYLSRNGYQAVLLPYAEGRLAMAVVLPDGPLATLRPKVAADGLRGLLAGTTPHRVTLSLPRFRLEADFSLIPVLRKLGVNRAFGDNADFGGITDDGRLPIHAILHKAYLDVDEKGTQAAAATAVTTWWSGESGKARVTMAVDRPFLLAIVDTPTGLPLFLGQVSHPRVS